MPVGGREVSDAAVTGDRHVVGVTNVQIRVQGSKLEIRWQAFSHSDAIYTRIVDKAPELLDTFFTAKRQCCKVHLRSLFR